MNSKINKPNPRPAKPAARLLIIGCGMATARLLERLVATEHGYEIEVVGAEPSAAYNRVLLSSLLAGAQQESDLTLLEDVWYARHHITLGLGESVVSVDLQQRQALTDRGRCIAWDKLVFATGSRPFIPAIAGLPARQILQFRDKQDLQQLRAAASCHHKIVVLGGGLLGLEAAYGLQGLGMQVTVVHRQPWILNRQLDQEGGQLLQAQLETMGIGFKLGVQVKAWHEKSARLELDDGQSLPCPMLVAATGVVPNMEVAQSAGLECAQGILVDNTMATNTADVYAIGECCQHDSQCYGLVAPVQEQAEILARQLSGDSSATYQYSTQAVHLKVAGVAMVSSGELGGAQTQSQYLRDPLSGTYRRLIFRNHTLTGFILVGSKQHAPWYQQLLDSQSDIRALRPWMMFGEQQPEAVATFLPEVKYANH